jgi:hypothetical protein
LSSAGDTLRFAAAPCQAVGRAEATEQRPGEHHDEGAVGNLDGRRLPFVRELLRIRARDEANGEQNELQERDRRADRAIRFAERR